MGRSKFGFSSGRFPPKAALRFEPVRLPEKITLAIQLRKRAGREPEKIAAHFFSFALRQEEMGGL